MYSGGLCIYDNTLRDRVLRSIVALLRYVIIVL